MTYDPLNDPQVQSEMAINDLHNSLVIIGGLPAHLITLRDLNDLQLCASKLRTILNGVEKQFQQSFADRETVNHATVQ